MEQPIARLWRRPRQRHGGAGSHQFRDDESALFAVERSIALSVADTIDRVVRAVEVHRMISLSSIDPAPVD
jgi:hypothetical protein